MFNTNLVRLRPGVAASVEALLRARTPGWQVVDVARTSPDERFRRDVLAGLAERPRRVSSAYLYDERGSALYEAITALPEYYPARVEEELLRTIAPGLGPLLGHAQIVELGSGSSWKTRRLLEAMGGGSRALTYVPVDVNGEMLRACGEALCAERPALRVCGLAGQFEDAFAALSPAADRLFVFLGGTIGNLLPAEQTAFFTALKACMGPRSHLLLGFDRRAHAGKPAGVIHAAYNDARGVTAEFNLNLLTRLNRELGANFQSGTWAHRAFYDAQLHRIEMHLVSLQAQRVSLSGLAIELAFAAGESILTEVSRKFDPDELVGWFERLGYGSVASWSDPTERFSLALFSGPNERRPVSASSGQRT